ncbi:MAG: DUF6930 domain-containing protein [Parcubacteria group bacterium]
MLDNWKKLYNLSLEFLELKPWEWIYDNNVFAVMDPKTKEIGYCSIMGNNKEFYGMAVYPGAEGFASLNAIFNQEIPEEASLGAQRQKCLMMQFDKRDYVSSAEMEIIKKIGIRFENRNFWTIFKDFTPGLCPWQLKEKDLPFMITVVEQALKIVLEFKDKKEVFTKHAPYKILTSVPEEKNKKIEWKYEYIEPEKYIKKEETSVINEEDERQARDLQKRYKKDKMIEWQLDYFYSPNVAKDDDNSRPFFPYIFMVVNGLFANVLGTKLVKQDISKDSIFRNTLLELIEEANYIPNKFLVRRVELAQILQDLAKILDVEIVLTDNLDFLDEAKADFIDFMKKNKI